MTARADIYDTGWDREDYEEPAGASFRVVLNPQDDVYGISVGSGTWIRGTPIFGDYFVGLLDNEIEESWYSYVGMTIRILPRWTVAPFVGAGGSYHYSLSSNDDAPDDMITPGPAESDRAAYPDQGDSYWGGHAEAGLRIRLAPPIQLLEIMGRYTWVSLDGDREYWLVGLATGTEF